MVVVVIRRKGGGGGGGGGNNKKKRRRRSNKYIKIATSHITRVASRCISIHDTPINTQLLGTDYKYNKNIFLKN